MRIDEALKEWATDRQRAYIDSVNEIGLMNSARKFNVSDGTIRNTIKKLKKRAAAQGYSPEHDLKHKIPEPYVARGHSTYYDQDGKPTQQWVKTRLDDQKWFEILRETAAALAEDLPRLKPTLLDSTVLTDPNLCVQYTLTDVHLGMLAWHEEGGANWDVKIAERVVFGAFENMIARSPAAKTCVIAQLGDWFHSDGLLPVTPGHGHVLDQDGRYAKIVRAGVRLLRRIVAAALEKHEIVHLLLAEGNHDESGSIWLREMFAALYEDEPRVIVVQTQLPFYSLQHGNTGLFYHHGHKTKFDQLPQLFAAMFPKLWGETTKRYGHSGHMHHLHEKEFAGIKITQHPTLTARDAYASRHGYIAERQTTSITYHKTFGEVARTIVTPEMLE